MSRRNGTGSEQGEMQKGNNGGNENLKHELE